MVLRTQTGLAKLDDVVVITLVSGGENIDEVVSCGSSGKLGGGAGEAGATLSVETDGAKAVTKAGGGGAEMTVWLLIVPCEPTTIKRKNVSRLFIEKKKGNVRQFPGNFQTVRKFHSLIFD